MSSEIFIELSKWFGQPFLTRVYKSLNLNIFISLLIVLLSICAEAQVADTNRKTKPEGSDEQVFNSSISVGLLFPAQIELNFYSSINHTDFFTDSYIKANNDIIPYTYKGDFLIVSNTLQGALGLSRRVAVGLEYTRTDNSSIYNDAILGKIHQSFHTWGTFIKWTPKKATRYINYVFSHKLKTVLYSQRTAYSLENHAIIFGFLTRYLTYSIQLSNNIQFRSGESESIAVSPFLYLGYRINTESMIFLQLNYQNEFAVPAWSHSDNMISVKSSVNIGIGLQKRFTRNLTLNMNGSLPLASKDFGGYETLNISARYVSMRD